MNILVTGGLGYLGAHVCMELMEAGHIVTAYDLAMFGVTPAEELYRYPGFRFIRADVRDTDALRSALTGQDAVVHLAAIVGDEACIAAGDDAEKVNYDASLHLAELAEQAGVKRLVFASTASVYAGQRELECTESTKVMPLSDYAFDKLRVENRLLELPRTRTCKPVILRFASFFGPSLRMRFDLVVNSFVLRTYRTEKIMLHGGEQWRPFLHVADAAVAVRLALEAPDEKVAFEIFNIGDRRGNYRIAQLGTLLQDLFRTAKVQTLPGEQDRRTYNVRFDKAEDLLGFAPRFTVRAGFIEIMNQLEAGAWADALADLYYNHKIKPGAVNQ